MLPRGESRAKTSQQATNTAAKPPKLTQRVRDVGRGSTLHDGRRPADARQLKALAAYLARQVQPVLKSRLSKLLLELPGRLGQSSAGRALCRLCLGRRYGEL